MAFKIVRNDITKMNTDAIVSPAYSDGEDGEERLRACYRNSLKLAREQGIRSIAFPLISTGASGYSKEEGIRIAADEFNDFLLKYDMEIYLVVGGNRDTEAGKKLYPGLQSYIDKNYEANDENEEYGAFLASAVAKSRKQGKLFGSSLFQLRSKPIDGENNNPEKKCIPAGKSSAPAEKRSPAGKSSIPAENIASADMCCDAMPEAREDADFGLKHEGKLKERMRHLSDTYSEYLMYLIEEKGLENADVYKRAIVDKKVFSKIKNNPDYHPQKITALCPCVGAMLNLDETRDLLARAGYALSPCDKTDVIFSYFIENGIYDMIDLDIVLEEYGLPCIIE